MTHAANSLKAPHVATQQGEIVAFDEHSEHRFRDSKRPTKSTVPNRLLRDRQTILHWIQWTTSLAWVLGTLHLVTTQPGVAASVEYKFLGVATVMLMLVIYRWVGVFHRYGSEFASAMRMTQAWVLVLLALVLMTLLIGTAAAYSPVLVGLWATLALAGQIGLQMLSRVLSRIWQRRLQVNIPAIVVGSSQVARHLAESINRNPFLPEFVAGVVDDPAYTARWSADDVPVLGELADLPDLLRDMNVDRIYIAMPMERLPDVAQLQNELLERNVDIIWAPDITGMNLINPCVRELAGVPLISLSESPLSSGGRAFMKALMDVFLASAALVALAPVMLVIAASIKATSKGPVLFRQQRHGWDGMLFEVWKFRSMILHDADQHTVVQATNGDPRVTRVGRFIRRTSLDELPQLFNVLNGTMSLVGPRPHAVPHNVMYSRLIMAYMARHRVKPGITGLAQVRGHRGETASVEKMRQRVQLDLEYINNWSLRLDLMILLRTPLALVAHPAY
ncbi:MAG: undecaprenyl-phosphate glucose phosphotransferase [Gammaproteobacteria bacterium]|nr:undecaprenyl-phosphate glucose phosphotransferase [Gammaproteobacteria bacterium]